MEQHLFGLYLYLNQTLNTFLRGAKLKRLSAYSELLLQIINK